MGKEREGNEVRVTARISGLGEVADLRRGGLGGGFAGCCSAGGRIESMFIISFAIRCCPFPLSLSISKSHSARHRNR